MIEFPTSFFATQTSLLVAQATAGQYRTPKAEEAYVPFPDKLPSGQGYAYGRNVDGNYSSASGERNPMQLLIDLNINSLDEEMGKTIGLRVKGLIENDEEIQKLIATKVRKII